MLNRHSLVAIFIFVILLGGGFWLVKPWQDYGRTQKALQSKEREIQQRQIDNDRLRREINDLKTDPQAVERVARDKFGWCMPTEKVYDFNP